MKFWKLIKKLDLNTRVRVYKCGLKYDGKAGDLRCANLFGGYGIENEVYHLSTSDGVLEIMLKDNGHNWDCGKSLRSLSPAQPERKKGHWEDVPHKSVEHGEVVVDGKTVRCSVCKRAEKGWNKGMNYCPNCGAKMEVEHEA